MTLARDDRVVGRSSSAGEIEVEVRAPARPTPFTAVLYPEDGEWECDCSSRERACAHVVAAVLAVGQAREAGGDEALPTSAQVGGALSYRMTAAPGGLNLERWVVHPDGREERLDAPLQSILAGRVPGPRVAAHDVDLLLDRLLASRPDAVLSGDRLDRLLGVLADAADLRLAGEKVLVSGEPVTPRATLEDHADGVRLTITRDPAVDEVVSFGVVRVGDVLRPVGETELGGGRLEKLPVVHDYGAAELTAVAATTLPALAARMPVDVRTDRLPQVGGAETPRVVFDVVQRGETLSVMATVVYGDPPRARLDGERLTHLGGELPLRDPQAERQLLYRLRDRLHLAPGRRVEVGGKDAIAMNAALAEWLRADARAAGDSPAAVLIPEVAVRGGRLDVTFAAGSRRAATDAVIRAWQAGADLVALEGGGWGQVPAAWLAQHGTRVADLLAACAGGDRVPMHALPDLGRLCEDLDLPPPPDLARLRPLIEDFDRAPEGRAAARDGRRSCARTSGSASTGWRSRATPGSAACSPTTWAWARPCRRWRRSAGGRWSCARPAWCATGPRRRGGSGPTCKVALYHGSRRKLDDDADLTLTSYAAAAQRRRRCSRRSTGTWSSSTSRRRSRTPTARSRAPPTSCAPAGA